MISTAYGETVWAYLGWDWGPVVARQQELYSQQCPESQQMAVLGFGAQHLQSEVDYRPHGEGVHVRDGSFHCGEQFP